MTETLVKMKYADHRQELADRAEKLVKANQDGLSSKELQPFIVMMENMIEITRRAGYLPRISPKDANNTAGAEVVAFRKEKGKEPL